MPRIRNEPRIGEKRAIIQIFTKGKKQIEESDVYSLINKEIYLANRIKIEKMLSEQNTKKIVAKILRRVSRKWIYKVLIKQEEGTEILAVVSKEEMYFLPET